MRLTAQERISDCSVRAIDAVPDLHELARRIDRLSPSHRDPEAFHIEKSEIAFQLRHLARTSNR